MAEDKASERVRLINTRSQPVELHLGSSVHVLAAGQSLELDAAALASPQLTYLLDRKALAVRSATPPEAAEAAGNAITPRRRGQGAADGSARPPQPPKRKKES
ncbi:hypothetical protein [Lysobacter sp. cf310]|uniref:hypothetical protein n=1 Tax=Lysobacter sp. cf310 TaxID=1761790 RepID=UPI0008EACC4E|nr:hypothetical protein [Lysobacter sp. cf310]SFK33720.1 hypothetical protein SAMN04487938_0373 [Lysobacter sp. cf310]